VADLDQLAGCRKRLLDTHGNLDALICYAGVMGDPLLLSPQGFELQIATNHLRQAALISALWPRAPGGSRTKGATRCRSPYRRYVPDGRV
jgi:NAD(P)-dependent dehydrogenase (short-subunit alcohol dehydrogenase family)